MILKILKIIISLFYFVTPFLQEFSGFQTIKDSNLLLLDLRKGRPIEHKCT